MGSVKKYFIKASFLGWYAGHQLRSFTLRHSNALLFSFGCAVLYLGSLEVVIAQSTPTFDTTEIDRATCSMYALLEGPYGALLTATAGFTALVSAVMGSYQSAYTFLTVGVGCFVARSVNSMYFGSVACEDDLQKAIDDYYSSGEGKGMIK